jgi:cyclophilin family peptidyl-prolyl cis-trans isomerase
MVSDSGIRFIPITPSFFVRRTVHPRMIAAKTQTQYSLFWAVCLFAFLCRLASGQESSSDVATPSPRQLTPEERQERKQARLQKEQEAAQQRIATFGVIPEDDRTPLADAYRTATEEFRKATAELADIQARLQFRIDPHVPEKDRYRWLDKLKNNYDKLVAMRNAAAELVLSDPTRYESVALMLREMLITEVAADRSDHWSRGARAILSCENLVTEDVLLNAGYAGFSTCDWELATLAWSPLAKQGKLPEIETRMLQEIPRIREAWAIELERRKQDVAKDNPRVEFLTTKGVMEIELFEDEAPESVANFIYLVEQGYYDRKSFFLVRRHWLAQTGCEKGDGKGTAGYTIAFEGDAPDHRNHYRGSVAIPLGVDVEKQIIDPNSGGAQFYFSMMPLPLFDGKHAVFGRVVSGIEVLGLLKEINLTEEEQRKDPSLQPDRVVAARVLKKRSHEYRPTPALGRLPR